MATSIRIEIEQEGDPVVVQSVSADGRVICNMLYNVDQGVTVNPEKTIIRLATEEEIKKYQLWNPLLQPLQPQVRWEVKT